MLSLAGKTFSEGEMTAIGRQLRGVRSYDATLTDYTMKEVSHEV